MVFSIKLSELTRTLWLCAYIPVNIEDRLGQQRDVVTYALSKAIP